MATAQTSKQIVPISPPQECLAFGAVLMFHVLPEREQAAPREISRHLTDGLDGGDAEGLFQSASFLYILTTASLAAKATPGLVS